MSKTSNNNYSNTDNSKKINRSKPEADFERFATIDNEELSNDFNTDEEGINSKNDNSPTKPKQPVKVLNSLWSILKFIIYLALLVAIGLGGYFGYQYYLDFQQHQQHQQQQSQQFTQLKQQLIQLQAQQQSQHNQLKEDWLDYRQAVSDQQQIWQQSIQQRQSILETRIDKVLSNNDYQWLFAEVHYWLSLAQQRMNDDANHAAVARLLKSARQQLSVIDWDESAIIKQAIDKDLELISNGKAFNLPLYFQEVTQTQQLINKAISHSTLIEINETEQAKVVVNDNDNSQFEWYQPKVLWINTKAFFAQFISISNTNSNHDQYLGRQQKAFLQQQIGLQFEQAKQALLNQQWSLYESIISDIRLALESLDMQKQQQWLDELIAIAKQRSTPEQLTLKSLVTFHQQMKLLNFTITKSP